MSKCKYYLEKEVVSYDGGITWNETGVTRKGNLYEESSEDCTDPSVQYRWINMDISTDYICDGTNKYYKQKKQVSYDGIIWQDVTPAEYQRGSIYEVNSPDCQPTYRWINLDITTDWICDGTTKYYKQKKQVSYGGQEWQDVIPYEYKRGSIYEAQSTDCGYVPPTGTKFTSIDDEGVYRNTQCDGNPLNAGDTHYGPELTRLKIGIIGDCVTEIGLTAFQATYYEEVTIPSSVKTIRGNAFTSCKKLNKINSDIDGVFNLPNGLEIIEESAFPHCTNFTTLIIPDSVTSIGVNAFNACSAMTSNAGLRNVTIGTGITEIRSFAFYNCANLTSVTIYATTPPTLEDYNVFSETSHSLIIYVPANSVETYKSASGWSYYSSRIQAIP